MNPAASKIWTILDILKWSESFLLEKGFPSPRTDAELLLMAVLGLERMELYIQFERPLSPAEREKYRNYIIRRANQEPVQYITGFTYFMGLRFDVSPQVLIPRFDTEVLVDTVIKKVKENYSKEKLTIIDIGTGSGAIAVSLAKYLDVDILALDISEAALAQARLNAEKHDVLPRIKFLHSDLLTEAIHHKFEQKTIIVSNPPYVTHQDFTQLPIEIKNHEPAQALLAEDGGFFYYKKILGQASIIGNMLAGVFFEAGFGQAATLGKLLTDKYHQPANIVKDIGGIDRVVYTLF